MSQIEKELLKASGAKPIGKTEDRQKYLVRLMKAVSKVEDDKWAELSSEAQEWNNGAAEAYRGKDKIEDFPDRDESVNEEIDEMITKDVEAREATTVPAEPKERKRAEPKAEPKEKPVARASNGRKVSACHMIKKIVIKKPTISVKELSEKLKDNGMKVSDLTISSIRSDTRDTMRVMNELSLAAFELA